MTELFSVTRRFVVLPVPVRALSSSSSRNRAGVFSRGAVMLSSRDTHCHSEPVSSCPVTASHFLIWLNVFFPFFFLNQATRNTPTDSRRLLSDLMQQAECVLVATSLTAPDLHSDHIPVSQVGNGTKAEWWGAERVNFEEERTPSRNRSANGSRSGASCQRTAARRLSIHSCVLPAGSRKNGARWISNHASEGHAAVIISGVAGLLSIKRQGSTWFSSRQDSDGDGACLNTTPEAKSYQSSRPHFSLHNKKWHYGAEQLENFLGRLVFTRAGRHQMTLSWSRIEMKTCQRSREKCLYGKMGSSHSDSCIRLNTWDDHGEVHLLQQFNFKTLRSS